MSVVIRYFSDSGVGAANGSTWNDRAAFLDGGVVSTGISMFDFSTDSLEARVEGGKTYTLTTGFATASFSGVSTPSASNGLFIIGCDSSGNRLTPNDYNWNCCKGPLDVTGYPVFLTTTNISTISAINVSLAYIDCQATNRSSVMISAVNRFMYYCRVWNKMSHTSASVINWSTPFKATNCEFSVSGVTGFSSIGTSALDLVDNCRIVGSSGATTGSRNGFTYNSGSTNPDVVTHLCLIDLPGTAIGNTSAATAAGMSITGLTINNCGTGLYIGAASSGNGSLMVANSYISNCGVGISIATTGEYSAYLLNTRLRNTIDITGIGDGPSGDPFFFNAAGSDSAEFVNASAGDYRIKSTSTYWNRHIGAGEEMNGSDIIVYSGVRPHPIGGF